ncbi:MAG: SusC/RagA family TonB-linked outer membrane protein [Bacteroidales bacterium]|nr:SusC/RagA family TonB-linked outer membrane protein [Bacteroidales bacterium]
MFYRLRYLLLGLMLMVASAAYAQNITVTGTVRDAETGEPVSFASIRVDGTMTGGMTDMDGAYSIDAPFDGVLIFSFIGYKDARVSINGMTHHDVLLHSDTQMIEETIVVAFGTATKESFTGSATVVKSEDISKVQSSDVTRALEGVVAGVQMTTSSGSLSSSPSIRIRGTSSISAGNAPLYVVDGVPYSGDMNNLNSADIESMTVLKDAASNALYGARGANGVIMITTKKAKKGEAVVTLDAKVGLNTKELRSYDYITDPKSYYEAHYNALYNYYRLEQGLTDREANLKASANVAGSSDVGGLGYLTYTVPAGQNLIGTDGKFNPNATFGRKVLYKGEYYWLQPDDWMAESYRNSIRQEYNVSAAGSAGGAQIFASFGYLNNKGLIQGEDMERYTARLRVDYQVKDWMKIGMNAGYSNFDWNNGNGSGTGNVFSFAANVAPVYPVYLRDGNRKIIRDEMGYKRYDYGDGANAGMLRPYAANSNALQELWLNVGNSEGNAINGTAYAEAKFLKDFTFTFNAGVGIDETRSTSILNMYYGQFATNGGVISKNHGRMFYLNLQQLLNWSHTFGGSHNVSALLGHETYSSSSVSLGASKSNMFSMNNTELNGAVIDGQSANSAQSMYNNEGFFLRAQYDYLNRIFFSASYRLDASSRFHPDHRWGNFWSVGGGWLIDKEPWFPQTSWLDMLKIKASIGSQGNDNIGDYLYTDMYSITNSEGDIAIKRSSIGNKNITWETNTNFNAGFDLEIFGGRLTAAFEYFYRLTSDMLYFVTIPISYGFSGYYDNIGDMRNSGVELALNGNIMRRRNFSWDAYINFTHYTNKVIMLPDQHKNRTVDGYQGYASGNKFVGEGLPLNTFLMPKYAGVDKTNGLPMWYMDIVEEDEDGNPILDENGNTIVLGRGTTTEYSEATDYLCDDPTPLLYGGFGTSFTFYGFDIAASFTYSIGGLAYDSGYAGYMSPPGGTVGSNYHKDVFKAWTPENPDSDIPRFVYNDQNINASSDRFLVPASYLNFQNAQFGYTFPSAWLSRAKIGRLRVYAMCDNIWYWSYRQGLDPRQSFSGDTSAENYSPVRTISFGVNLTF